MRKERYCKNSLQLTYELMKFIYDNEIICSDDIKDKIKILYSENKNTINNHLLILKNSGFITSNKIDNKIYYTFYRKRGNRQ